MRNITGKLKEIFNERVFENEALAKHTNFRVGGSAKWLCVVKTSKELIKALDILGDDISYFILGAGSNVLATDQGYDGVVFKISIMDLEIDGILVTAGSGVLATVLARTTANAGLRGLEWAATLPGTVGGMVRGNAGCFGGETKDNLVSVQILRAGEIIMLLANELDFRYRHSIIKKTNDIILSATFKLEVGDKKELKIAMNKMMEKRKSGQPLTSGTAGCTFKNYEIRSDDNVEKFFEFGVPQAMIDIGRISAGWLIDKADLKGIKIGGIRVSNQHGNFLINDGTGTADQIVQLISLIKMKIRDKFGIELTEEIQYL